MNRVPVQPNLVRWARERAGYSVDALVGRFPKIGAWECGELLPTLKQLEAFAKATHIPIGYFFLVEPPEQAVPVPDFRSVANIPLGHPSPDLLDTVYLCQPPGLVPRLRTLHASRSSSSWGPPISATTW